MTVVIDMSFDGTLVKKVTKELQDTLTTGRITKIYQLSNYDLLLMIHAKSIKQQLIISASPNYARIHLTNFTKERPEQPPQFAMFLRKHIEGGIVQDITQYNNDRVITFDILKRNELGDQTIKKLIVEVTGRHANIIVTDDQFKIIDALKHNMPFEGTARTIFPSASYQYPPSNKINPFDEIKTKEWFYSQSEITEHSLLEAFEGISPLFTKEVMFRHLSGLRMYDAFIGILYELNPVIIAGKKDYFYYTDLLHIQGERKVFTMMNDMLDRYYLDRDAMDITREKSKNIVKLVRNHIEKAKYKIEKLTKELKQTDKRDTYKIKGELIQANLYKVAKGDSVLNCLNYYDDTEISIVLDPKKDAIGNMEKYFKKYKKLRVSIPYLHAQISDANNELQYFLELEHQMEYASLKDIEEIKDELEQLKYIKHHQTKHKKNKKPNYDTYFTPSGVEIVVGKNNLQNEYITHKLAHRTDVWFHTKGGPGSHVVVRETFPLSEETIRAAANLAAYFSKMRRSNSVPVDYVLIKHLKKVPGKINSFVTYTNQKTIYIDPDEDAILQLQKK